MGAATQKQYVRKGDQDYSLLLPNNTDILCHLTQNLLFPAQLLSIAFIWENLGKMID